MFHKTIIMLLLLFSASIHILSSKDLVFRAEDLTVCSGANKKYTISMCAIFMNEALQLKKWIEHHRLLGVEHFYLYNIGSKDNYQLVLIPYINEGLVTLVNWPNAINKDDIDGSSWAISMQISAFENAVNFLAREETKWLILAEINEFLECHDKNIQDILLDYEDYPSIALSINTSDVESADKSNLNKNIPSEAINSHSDHLEVTKMIFKPDHCSGFTWPPYTCCFNTRQSIITANPQEIHIERFPSINKIRPSHENLPKYSAAQTFMSDDVEFKLFRLKYDFEKQDQPMYLYMPEFLKKLKNMETEIGPF